jgi:hypothetical protein
MTDDHRYTLSYTAIGLGLSESVKMAACYLRVGDWDRTREVVVEENLLQSRTMRRSKRVAREIAFRLSLLTSAQLDLLLEGSLEEQRQLLWFAVCNYYQFIRAFAVEVLHEKFLIKDMHLAEADFRAFFLRKLDWHPELDEITESTQTKLRTVLFRMMREAALQDADDNLIRMLPGARLARALRSHADFAYHIYPAYPMEFES